MDIMKRVDGESFFFRKEDSFFDSAAVFMSQYMIAYEASGIAFSMKAEIVSPEGSSSA